MSGHNGNDSRPGFKIKNGVFYACNGQGLKQLLQAGQQWLEAHLDEVNGLNVFPVPDGDTGTNMALTLRAAVLEMDRATDHRVATIAASAARGALLGARGNSGVILSQFLQGLALGLEAETYFTPKDLARATSLGVDWAYRSVAQPVEGTILTVARAVADAARQHALDNHDLPAQVAGMVEAARIAQASTPDLLPVLKEAGVTDSGGQGLLYILEGVLRFLRNQPLYGEMAEEQSPVFPAAFQAAEGRYGYEVQCLIRGRQLDVAEIRDYIATLGQSAVVVGDEQTVKVHVHVADPGLPLSYAAGLGSLTDIVVENLTEQAQGFLREQTGRPGIDRTGPFEPGAPMAVIAVVAGAGLANIFKSLGVTAIVAGGQSMNPSTGELLAAVEQVAAPEVLVLPNNSNIISTVEQIQQLSSKPIGLVPTTSVPQGIAALLRFNPQTDLRANQQAMAQAAARVKTLEITRAVRDTTVKGLPIEAGQFIGLLDHQLQSAGSRAEAVALDLLAQLQLDPYEVLTVYVGQNSSPEQAAELIRLVREQYPHLETELHDGNQPYYQYIISVE